MKSGAKISQTPNAKMNMALRWFLFNSKKAQKIFCQSKTAIITISGGEIAKLNFKGLTESVTLAYLGGKILATTVENVTAKGALSLGDGITAESLGAAAAIFTEKAERVVFVKDGATGSGVSAASPISPTEGFKLLKDGGTKAENAHNIFN